MGLCGWAIWSLKQKVGCEMLSLGLASACGLINLGTERYVNSPVGQINCNRTKSGLDH